MQEHFTLALSLSLFLPLGSTTRAQDGPPPITRNAVNASPSASIPAKQGPSPSGISAVVPPMTNPPGTGPALGDDRISQDDITGGGMTLKEIRRKGMEIFSTPFNEFDGMGDGPSDPMGSATTPGNRVTVGDNGVFMRVNGLDSQTCLECHSVRSNRSIPATFAIGGVGGIAATAFPSTYFDVADQAGNGYAEYIGRLINPPFVWGSGGVELLAKEMTADLQDIKDMALGDANTPYSLDTHGVNFGTLVYDGVSLVFSDVVGIDTDLVVKPFGRKGNVPTLRAFDTGAMAFHHGMQAEEVTDDLNDDGMPDDGVDIDGDGDGVYNEIKPGELSAMHIFQALTEKPREIRGNQQQVSQGRQNFHDIGCAECHIPEMETTNEFLPIAYPEVLEDPWANVFLSARLKGGSAGFKSNGSGGVTVLMYSDLKRHDVDTSDPTPGDPLSDLFITPRLWGIADTAPYMHDGSKLSISEAIEAHGNDAAASASSFQSLSQADQIDLLAFLDTLRAPKNPNKGL